MNETETRAKQIDPAPGASPPVREAVLRAAA
jgi:hypothetical protein